MYYVCMFMDVDTVYVFVGMVTSSSADQKGRVIRLRNICIYCEKYIYVLNYICVFMVVDTVYVFVGMVASSSSNQKGRVIR